MCRLKWRFLNTLVSLLMLLCTACGGGSGSSGSGGPPPTITSLSVTSPSTTVQPGAQLQFTATVSGTGNFSQSVTWSVSGSSDDGNLGTISSSGLYTASASPPNPNTVTIKATSAADATKSGTASVVVGSSPFQITGVTISPTTPTVKTAATQQFTATVQGTGSFSTAVTWLVDGGVGGDLTIGTISSTGLYSAPQTLPGPDTVTVTATSAVDTTLSATAQVSLIAGPPAIAQLSPSTANAADTIQINGTNLMGVPGSITTVFFPSPGGMQLAVLPRPDMSSPTQLNLVVPLSAMSGQVFVQVQEFGGPLQTSNNATFTRLPRVRIRAAQQDLSEGESVSFQSRILGSGTTETLTWTADVGSVSSSGTYTPPASVISDSFAVVTACVEGTQICDQQRLGLHPFRIVPTVPIVASGKSLQLSGIQGSATIAPAWQLNGPGELTSGGDYTASSLIAGAGGVPVTATHSGITEQTSLSVTSSFPGIVHRVVDYIDLNQASLPLGTFAVNVGTTPANRAYVEGTDQEDFVLQQNYYWVDVYDITDPTNPVWVDAFEPVAPGQRLSCDGYLYQMAPIDYSAGLPFPGVIGVYDVSGAHPVLLSRQISPVATPVLTSQTGCIFTEISLSAFEALSAGGPVVLDQFNFQRGNVVHTQYSVTLPSSVTVPGVQGFASDGNRLFLVSDTYLIAYDLTTQPPTQVGLSHSGLATPVAPGMVGNLLFLPDENLEEQLAEVYDISASQPALLTTLPVGPVLAFSGTTVVAGGNGQTGLRTIDISNSQQPTLFNTSFDYVDAQYTVATAGNYTFSTEGEGGLAVYDLSEPGGLLPTYLATPTGAVPGSPAFAQAANTSNLYFAIALAGSGGGVLAYDVSTQPATPLGTFSTGSSLCQALALSNNYLYVGAVDSLRVLDVSNPANPTQLDSISVGMSALATTGNTLFAGTGDNRLIVYDITNPARPSQLTSINLSGLAIEFAVSGNLLLVADSTAGLLVYNITTPTSPALLSQTMPSSSVTDVTVDGTLALLAAWDGGLVVLDLTNPSAPQVLGQAKLDTIDPFATNQSYC